jgi:hypothetical protein
MESFFGIPSFSIIRLLRDTSLFMIQTLIPKKIILQNFKYRHKLKNMLFRFLFFVGIMKSQKQKEKET